MFLISKRAPIQPHDKTHFNDYILYKWNAILLFCLAVVASQAIGLIAYQSHAKNVQNMVKMSPRNLDEILKSSI